MSLILTSHFLFYIDSLCGVDEKQNVFLYLQFHYRSILLLSLYPFHNRHISNHWEGGGCKTYLLFMCLCWLISI